MESFVSKKNYNREYEMMRGILTLLAVMGHSCYTELLYGAMEVSYSAPVYHIKMWECIWKIHKWIYSFHMPAFFALSGAIFYITRKHYDTLESLVIKKGKRLLVPFVWCGVFYTIPLKYLGGGYDSETIGIAIQGMFFASGDAGHLWFLPTLFWCFFLTGIVIYSDLREDRKNLILGIVTWILYLRLKNNNLKIPYLDFSYLLWFVAGYLF